MGIPTYIPTPEQLQYMFGIHPEQQKAEQAQMAAQQPPAPQQGQQEDTQPQPIGAGQPRPAGGPSEQGTAPQEAAEAPGEEKAAISTPGAPSSPQPVAAPAAEPSPNPNLPGAKPALPAPLSGATPRPISADQEYMQGLRGQEDKDRAEVNRLNATGSGVDQFMHHHHILGPIVKALSIAGSAYAPSVAAMVPGTDLHHQVLVNQAGGRVATDIGAEKEHAAMNDKEAIDRARQETADTKQEANRIREQQNQAMDELRRQAQESKNSLRAITYDPKTKQFMRGAQPYTPKDFQEGAILETQHGLNGRYTQMWLQEKRNQSPQTHVHTPSAEAETLHEWKAAFQQEYGRAPNAEEITTYKHGDRNQKDYTNQRVGIENKKEAELHGLEKDFNRDWSKAQSDDERNALTAGLNKNKERVQKAYEAELAQIPTGTQQPRERITNAPKAQPNNQAAAAPTGSNPSPQTHVFSAKAWLKANPGGDVNAARAAAKAQKYTIAD